MLPRPRIVKSEPGPPIDTRGRGGCFGVIAPSLDASRPSPCLPDRMVPPLRGASPSCEPHGFAGSHTALPGTGSAAIRSNPLRRHLVPPNVAQVPIPAEMAERYRPETPFPTGVGGWSVPYHVPA
jgi:hypothetical protein